MTTVKYQKETDKFVVYDDSGNVVLTAPPEYFIHAFDDCLVFKLYSIRLKKVANMERYIEDNLKLTKQLEEATDKFTLAKIVAIKNVMKEIRHCVRMAEIEEEKVKGEMLERRAGIKDA